MKVKISRRLTMAMFVLVATALLMMGITDWKGALLIVLAPIAAYHMLYVFIMSISKPLQNTARKTFTEAQTHFPHDNAFRSQSLSRKTAISAILNELDKAERKFPEWPKDKTRQAVIVNVKANELIRTTLQDTYESGLKESIEKEAIQTAAMGLRFLLNCKN